MEAVIKTDVQLLADAFARLRIARSGPEQFKPRDARHEFEVRDLGMAEATHGRVGAFHMRALGPCTRAQGWHWHKLDFHMVYILKGRVTYRWQGSSEDIVVEAGGCLYQPPGGAHDVIDYSADLEVLEITMPAAYETLAL
jgi:mannose-6-phosphate isomerase-like protein (cupin superfamily)